MKKFVTYLKKYYSNILSIFALIVSIIQVDFNTITIFTWLKISLFGVSIILLIIDMVLCREHHTMSKEKLIKKTKKMMLSATNGKIVMFGGDISWAYDYVETIKSLVKNDHYIVEIIFPETKLSEAEDKTELCKRIELLRDAGAKVYTTKDDVGLRATLVDVDINSTDLKRMPASFEVISSRRKGPEKNKYLVDHYKKESDEMQCSLKYAIYLLVKKSKEYSQIEDNKDYKEYIAKK